MKTQKTSSKSVIVATAVLITLVALTNPALAQDGGILGNASSILQKVATALKALGVIILTLALMWTGYQIMWKSAKFQEIATPVIGGIIVGSAAVIAGIIMA